MADFRYPPLITGNGMMCCKEGHPLLLEWFPTFLRCIIMIRGASDSIYKTPVFHNMTFLLKTTLKLLKMSNWSGYPPCTQHGMLSYKERQPLLLECSITFLECNILMRRAFDIIYKILMVPIIFSLPRTNLIFHVKWQISGTLSAQEMGWCDARRDIHCCWKVSQSSLRI